MYNYFNAPNTYEYMQKKLFQCIILQDANDPMINPIKFDETWGFIGFSPNFTSVTCSIGKFQFL